ncbi:MULTISPECIES: transposase [Acidiplasma]|uniref:Uncharacterized protein n=2 Tax=Acidiplasma TaxID=507753 RepID=A0A0Q0VPR3_9ARCH|nr:MULTISPECIES: transposase [Acidiplasma]KJE50057.1 hypothetical protein TZ01_03110 [Acidiplasma sp. MBA-1]KPV46971.1 hypothetical protein SE19_03085 [Acidiplasma aeolicum]KQB35312.1 hypothetical protein AOG54_03175 [Acidiplasma aeolicum]KQB35698.1 hypothetical protein AOG55_06115 [Acidiplasma cupricumulans]WMT55274.1 MAG: transposase [Acidiplasma sp.]
MRNYNINVFKWFVKKKNTNILKDIFNNKYSSSISKITDLTLEGVNKFVTRKPDNRYIAVMLDGLFFDLRRETVNKE